MLACMFTAVAYLLSSPFAAKTTAPDGPVHPPFVRSWTYASADNLEVFVVDKQTVYFTDSLRCGALNITDGKLVWSVPLKERSGFASLVAGKIDLTVRGQKNGTIESIDAASHEVKKLGLLPGEWGYLAVTSDALYTIDGNSKITRLNLTGTPLWSKQLPGRPQMRFFSSQIVATPAGLYVESEGQGALGLDAHTGAIRWSHKVEYAGLYPVDAVGDDVLVRLPKPGR